MRAATPPLRFLALVVGGWVCLRAAILVPGWMGSDPAQDRKATTAPAGRPKPVNAALPRVADLIINRPSPFASSEVEMRLREHVSTSLDTNRVGVGADNVAFAGRLSAGNLVRSVPPFARRSLPATTGASAHETAPGPLSAPSSTAASRWSGSAWAFVRRGSSASLAPGGILGGSQIGGRLNYRLGNREHGPFALSARFYAPLEEFGAAEAAAGIDWQPLARLPVHLLTERRQALGRSGRSAFSLLAYGGISDRRLAGPLLIDIYGQAGVVGVRSRDLFADGAVRAGIEVRRGLKMGAGGWAVAQPGASRVDVGPQLSLRLPIGGATIGLAADWRFRVAGDARPNSGPALTLSTDF